MTDMQQSQPGLAKTEQAQSDMAMPALVALIGGAVCISFSAIFVRLSDMDPTISAFYRVALALPILWAWRHFEHKKHTKSAKQATSCLSRRDLIALAFTGAFFAGDLIFWHSAIDYTSVANATLLANFAPIFVSIGAWLLFGEKIRPLFVVALLLSLVGAATMVSASFSVSGDAVKGDMLGLVTAGFYSAYLLTVKGLREKMGAADLMFWSSLGTAIVILPFALMTGEPMIPTSLETWTWLILLAWFSHALGQTLIAVAFGSLPAGFSSLALLLQPCLTALFGYLVLSETLGLLQSLGGMLVLLGVWLAKRSGETG